MDSQQSFPHIKLLQYRLFCADFGVMERCTQEIQDTLLKRGTEEVQVHFLLQYCQCCKPGLCLKDS